MGERVGERKSETVKEREREREKDEEMWTLCDRLVNKLQVEKRAWIVLIHDTFTSITFETRSSHPILFHTLIFLYIKYTGYPKKGIKTIQYTFISQRRVKLMTRFSNLKFSMP